MNISAESLQALHLTMRFDGQELSMGTGFLCKSARGRLCLLTNRHNVTGRRQDNDVPLSPTGGVPNEVVIRMPRVVHQAANYGTGAPATFGLAWESVRVPLVSDNGPRWVEHPVLAARGDFVALPLDLGYLPDANLICNTVVEPNRQFRLGPTDQVSIIGFPFGMSAGENMAIWVNGTIASELDIPYNNLPVMLVDCRSRAGQSGSPVIAYRQQGSVKMKNGDTSFFTGPVSNFMGIYSGRIREDSDIGMVWTAAAVNELLTSF